MKCFSHVPKTSWCWKIILGQAKSVFYTWMRKKKYLPLHIYELEYSHLWIDYTCVCIPLLISIQRTLMVINKQAPTHTSSHMCSAQWQEAGGEGEAGERSHGGGGCDVIYNEIINLEKQNGLGDTDTLSDGHPARTMRWWGRTHTHTRRTTARDKIMCVHVHTHRNQRAIDPLNNKI